MSANIVPQNVKTLTLPRNASAICPDCGAELHFLSHPRVTTCYCPRCDGGGAVSYCGGWRVAWTAGRGVHRG